MSTKNTILLALFIGLLLIILVYFLYYHFLPKLNSDFIPNNEIRHRAGSYIHGVKLMFFSTSPCPYSDAAKIEWDKLQNEYDGKKKINDIKIKFVGHEGEIGSEKEEILDKYNIEGFPTVILVIPPNNSETGDEIVKYFSGEITKENLETFLKEFL